MNEEALRAEVAAVRAELHRARQETAAREAELVAATKLATLGSLVAGIAHELNSPLGALNGNHDLLRRALGRLQAILEDERVDEHELIELRRVVRALHDILEVNDLAVARMVELVQSLRTFGRPDRAERDRVDLRESLDSTLALLDHQLRDQIRVVRDYAELPLVDCFPSQLNQLFMNLLVNAAQSIQGQGSIIVRTRADGDQVVVEIEDTGVGIPEQNLEHIFEPGFTTKAGRIGMGLGLLIVRQIVDQHRGTITVQSKVGVGTRFIVSLPMGTAAATP